MTSTTGSKRSKIRDLLIIIRLFICCIAIVLVNWLTYVVERLCARIQYVLETFNAQSKKPQSVACIKVADIHRAVYKRFQRCCLQGAKQAKNKTRTHDQRKKRSGSGRRRMNCSYLHLTPPVEELVFTRNDVWRTKNDTSKLTQPQLRAYSGDSVKCNPDMCKTHRNQVNCFPISFSREIKQSVPRANSSYVQTLKTNVAVSRRDLGWLQQDSHLQPKANCRCSHSSSVHPRFTTLSLVNTGKQASLKMGYAQQDVISKLMKRDNVSDDQLSSRVETWNGCLSTQKLSHDVALDSVDGSENNREVLQAIAQRSLTASVNLYRECNPSDSLMDPKKIGFPHSSLFQDALKVQNLPLNCAIKEAVAKTLLQNRDEAKTPRPNPLPALKEATFKSSKYVDHTHFLELSAGVALKGPVKSLSGN